MTSNQQVCPNGHPLARPGMTFCETCGAPIGAAVGTAMGAVSYVPATTPPAGGRSNAPLLAALAVAAIIAVAVGSYFVLAPKAATTAAPSFPVAVVPTGTPSAVMSAVPSAVESAAPSAVESAAPSAVESAVPSAVESAAPSATAVAGKTCHSDKFGVTVTYPTAWYEYTGDADRTCALFDPKPFPTITDGSEPQGAIEIFSQADPMAKVVADYQGAGGKVLRNMATTVDGRAATLLEIDDSGNGVAPNGMHEYMYLIDMGQTTLCVATQGIYDPSVATADWPYDGYKDNVKVVDSIAATLKFD